MRYRTLTPSAILSGLPGGGTPPRLRGLPVLLLMVFGGYTIAYAESPDPAASYYHFSLAKLYHLNEDYENAVAEFEKALRSDPESTSLLTEFATTLEKMDEIDRAVELCRLASRLEPENPQPHLLLGRIFARFRNDEDMQAKALAEFAIVLEKEPDNRDALKRIAPLYLDSGRYQEAADTFEKLRQVSPGALSAYFYGVRALVQLGRTDEAIQVLEDGLQIRDDQPDYLLLLGELYRQTNQLEAEVSLYKRALASSSSLKLKRRLAETLLLSGNGGEAIPLFQDVIDIYPDAKYDLGRALRAEKKLGEAAKVFEDILRQAPDDVSASFELARTLAMMGEKDKAIARFEHLTLLDDPRTQDHQPLFKTNLALLYEDVGKIDEALKLLQHVANESPEDLGSRLRLFYV